MFCVVFRRVVFAFNEVKFLVVFSFFFNTILLILFGYF